jgi:hypothetical protein
MFVHMPAVRGRTGNGWRGQIRAPKAPVSTCDFVVTGEAMVRVQLPNCFARHCNNVQPATVLDPTSGALKSPVDLRIKIRNALSGKFTGLVLEFIGNGHR